MATGIEEAVEGYSDEPVEPGVWRYARASRVRVMVDGEDYFGWIRQAMLRARQRILLIGWDFDTRIHLVRSSATPTGTPDEAPTRLGAFILWLNRNRPALEIRILKWSYSLLALVGRGSMVLDLARWSRHRRIDFKFDDRHPFGCSHHQKLVVVDDSVAVCGGIDMTAGRWDTRRHQEHDPRRVGPDGTPCKPWHDVSMMMEGEVAGALDLLGRARWVAAGGRPLDAPRTGGGESCWPPELRPHFEDVEIGIARTRAAHGGLGAVDEIARLFCAHIARAKRFVYIENQYLASRLIGEAIARRLAEPEPPEFIVVHPVNAHGWIEAQAMDPMRDELLRALAVADHAHRFHLYVPYSGQTPIYVHAKLMIVDDRILRIGSANLNNRSLGLDTECDVFIDCDRPGNGHAEAGIRRIRQGLLAEHMGLFVEDLPLLERRYASLAELIAGVGARGPRQLRPYNPPSPEELTAELAQRQVFDPETPEELFALRDHRRGLFRPGSLLARARARARDRLAGKFRRKDDKRERGSRR